MFPIIKKEINSFFSSPMGYLTIGIFLLINGLFLWIFSGNFNVLDSGFADLSPFFTLAPWVFLFLIPAVTMRSFSEEFKMGTMELLFTKPISLRGIVLGKYLGAMILVGLALIPTLLYVYTISQLGNPQGNWDVGVTVGSYLGLVFLAMVYTSIGIFCSTLTQSQIVAFLIALALCFAVYFSFEGFAELVNSNTLESFGLKAHYENISRGIVDTRDLIYFVSVTVLFIGFTIIKLKRSQA